MEHETLFTATKWDILKALEGGAQSPIELAKILGSSLANVSQQLRLLELAGLVKSQRVSNRDKDKPRILYSLAGNMSYLIATSDNFVEKKLLQLSDTNKIILRIWFLEDKDLRYALEKAFWQLESHLAQIEHISYAGFEKGIPLVEYSGKAKLPKSVVAGGKYETVLLRHSAKPSGYELR